MAAAPPESSVDFELTDVLPLPEVSGLDVQRDRDGRTWLVAVGDSSSVIAVAQVLDGELGPWRSRQVVAVERTQLEAVAVDGADHMALLAEEPSQVTLVDAERREVLAVYDLDPTPIKPLARAWEDENSRGEGLLLMHGGHLLVAKEKRPAALVEFGPAGEAALGVCVETLLGPADAFEPPADGRLEALAWWPLLDGLDDVSDLAVGPDDGLYLLSDRSAAIARLRAGLRPQSEGARVDHVWRLGKQGRKAEGLAFLPDGRVAVAVDRHDAGQPSLGLLPPGVLTV